MNFSRNSTAYVYLAWNKKSGLYKIGTTNNLERRLELLAGSHGRGNPDRVVFIHTIKTTAPFALEAALHKRYWLRRIQGEWYKLNKKDVSEICSLKDEKTESMRIISGGGLKFFIDSNNGLPEAGLLGHFYLKPIGLRDVYKDIIESYYLADRIDILN